MTLMSSLSGSLDSKQAIATIRQQLRIIEKKENFLQKIIGENLKKAKANVVSNKVVGIKALRNKQQSEAESIQLYELRLQLEQRINALESADLNLETVQMVRKASDVLERIQGRIGLDDLDATIARVHAQRELANEFPGVISAPTEHINETEIMEELAELEQAELDERLATAEHIPSGAREAPKPIAEEDDEEAQLRELQASLAM